MGTGRVVYIGDGTSDVEAQDETVLCFWQMPVKEIRCHVFRVVRSNPLSVDYQGFR
jgi:2-hydroxy-3-keto-5-methylthiopentenyl-1-phosphate phosphatase